MARKTFTLRDNDWEDNDSCLFMCEFEFAKWIGLPKGTTKIEVVTSNRASAASYHMTTDPRFTDNVNPCIRLDGKNPRLTWDMRSWLHKEVRAGRKYVHVEY